MNVVVMTDSEGYGWHAARIREAFAARSCEVRFVALPECTLETDGGRYGVGVPGFDEGPPDAVFVRNVPRGSLQEIVFYLGVLHALGHCEAPVYNTAAGIERTVDKSMTSFLLRRAGIATPPFWAGCDPGGAREWMRSRLESGRRVVVKPLFGSQGRGLRLLEPGGDEALEIEEGEGAEGAGDDFGGVYYLQEFVDAAAEGDWRVFVINGEAVAGMERRGDTWINNIATGACGKAIELDAETARIAVDATRVCGLDYAGVDLIKDVNNKAQVIEVNSVPAWRGLQEATGMDVAARLVDHIVSRHYASVA